MNIFSKKKIFPANVNYYINQIGSPQHARTSSRKDAPIGLTIIIYFLLQLLPKMTIHPHKHKGSPQRTTKSITLGGTTNPFLSTAIISTEKVVEVIKLVKRQMEVVMFSTEVSSVLSKEATG